MIEECPIAPGRTASTAHPAPLTVLTTSEQAARPQRRRRADGKPGKQDLLIALAAQRHDLPRLPLNRTARIAAQIGAEVNLHPGTARRVLRAHVQSLQQHATPATATEPRP